MSALLTGNDLIHEEEADPRTIAPRQPGAKTSRSQTASVGPAPAV